MDTKFISTNQSSASDDEFDDDTPHSLEILSDTEKLEKLAEAYKTILEVIGEDPEREGLLKTPMRAAKSILFCTQGYTQNLDTVLNKAIFQQEHSEMIIVKDITFYSTCEHHLLPFFGKAHIGYIPNHKVVGLSKLARITEMFSRKLQIQERLTEEIADAIMQAVDAKGVAVVLEAEHMCMSVRGVQKIGCKTITSCLLGELKENEKLKNEFYHKLSM
ncbi:hypothetical protein WA158_000262 [Blastocystis sp. Blastoise]